MEIVEKIAIRTYSTNAPSGRSHITLATNLFSFLLDGEKTVHYSGKALRIDPTQFLLLGSSNCLMSEKLSTNGLLSGKHPGSSSRQSWTSIHSFWTDSPISSPALLVFLQYKIVYMKKFSFLWTLVLGWGLASAQTFTLKSNELGGQATNRQFLNSFGCHGDNISPELSWANAPAGTQSFAVTIYDKDAPTGSGFWHWLIFNIPANVMELKSDAGAVSKNLAPAGSIQSNNDMGQPGYVGPCPPPRSIHEYLITVYALKTKLSLDKNTPPALVGFNLNANTLGKASIVFYAQQ